jgi:Tol biopolymer transport system component
MLLVNMAGAGNGEMGDETIVTSLKRVSVSDSGEEGDGESTMPAISADGRYVTFYSLANNLVMSDTNIFVGWDVFVYDLETDTIELVSVNSVGEQGNALSTWPDISADGRYVVYSSYATNLVINDTNNLQDIFVFDRQTSMTTRVSVNSVGEQDNGNNSFPKISADGRFAVFDSNANNLVANDANLVSDVFVHDLQTSVTERVSVSSQGIEGSCTAVARPSPAVAGLLLLNHLAATLYQAIRMDRMIFLCMIARLDKQHESVSAPLARKEMATV